MEQNKKDWLLQTKEIRRTFANATWIPLKANRNNNKGDITKIGYIKDYFGCNSIAFFPKYKEYVNNNLDWNTIGISYQATPYAYDDGDYKPVDEFQYEDKKTLGINLVFDHTHPVSNKEEWIINPDLIIALGLVKENNEWVRPQEDYQVVIREHFDDDGNHNLIEIKKEFLLDYLSARNLLLRLSYFRQRVENITELNNSDYIGLENIEEKRNNGVFEVLIRKLSDIYGGLVSFFRVYRTDIDNEEDNPVMDDENSENTGYENNVFNKDDNYQGIRVESNFWRNEWIEHKNISTRIRGDKDTNLPLFITETDGTRTHSSELNNEEVGRWLWFRSQVVNELLKHRGFSLKWYTAKTGGICSTSSYCTHFGINNSDLIQVYAYDIAKLNSWEQHIWAAYNVVPEKVCDELLSAQMETKVAETTAVEVFLLEMIKRLEYIFNKKFHCSLFNQNINEEEYFKNISRFISIDKNSLLTLAKEIIRVFSDRLNKESLLQALKSLSVDTSKLQNYGTNKLLEKIIAQKIGEEQVHKIFAPIVGTYEMRIGDAHPTSSKIDNAFKLAGIDKSLSYLQQGEYLINNFACTLFHINKILYIFQAA